MSNKLHEFDLTPYPQKLWIAISTDKFEDLLKGAEDLEKYHYADVGYVSDKNGMAGYLLRFENKKAMTMSNIAHEASHVAMDCLDYIGEEVNLKNQEYFAYLLGYIVECIEKVKKHKSTK